MFKWICYFPSSDKDEELVSNTVSANIEHDKLHGSRATALTCMTVCRCFFCFFSRTITDNLNMSSCQQFSCVRKEHDELGCNVACLSKINKLHKQRKTQNVTTALENKQQLFLRETCVHSAAIVYPDDTMW